MIDLAVVFRSIGLRMTVRKITKNILEEAGNRVTNGTATDLFAALKQLSDMPPNAPDAQCVEDALAIAVYLPVSRALLFDPKVQSEKYYYKICELSLKHLRRYQKKLVLEGIKIIKENKL